MVHPLVVSPLLPPLQVLLRLLVTDVPLPTTSDVSDIRRTLDHVLTVQAAYGQILVDLLNEIRAVVDGDVPPPTTSDDSDI